MSTAAEIQEAIVAQLRAHPDFPEGIEIVSRIKRDPNTRGTPNVIDAVNAALTNLGACLYVFRPVMRRVTKGADFIFVESGLVTVRIIDQPELNRTGYDADDLFEEVALCLHGSNPGCQLEASLELDNPPCADREDEEGRIIDAFFDAVWQQNPKTPNP